MSKDEFIEKLTRMTKEELQEFIHQKGKAPKMIQIVTPISNYNN